MARLVSSINQPPITPQIIKDPLEFIPQEYPEFSHIEDVYKEVVKKNLENKGISGVFSMLMSYEDRENVINELSEFVLNFIPKILIDKKVLRVRQEIIVKNIVFYILGLLFESYNADILDNEHTAYILEEMIKRIAVSVLEDQITDFVTRVDENKINTRELDEFVNILFSKILTLSGFLYRDIKKNVNGLFEKNNIDGDIIGSFIRKRTLKIIPDERGYNKYLFDFVVIVDLW